MSDVYVLVKDGEWVVVIPKTKFIEAVAAGITPDIPPIYEGSCEKCLMAGMHWINQKRSLIL